MELHEFKGDTGASWHRSSALRSQSFMIWLPAISRMIQVGRSLFPCEGQ